MRVVVIGAGYVGLVTGACLADAGNDVAIVDVDGSRIARLRQGHCPIHEPGLEDVIARRYRDGRLVFATAVDEVSKGADVFFIAVGTPANKDGSADISSVLAAADAIGGVLSGWAVIATKSTVPVGTAEKVRDAIRRRTDRPFAVASNPEFLKEGDAIRDFTRPDRVVVGSDSQHAIEKLRTLYAPFLLKSPDRFLVMDARSAELTKYAANAYLATRISFVNEVALLCEKLGADVEKVRIGVGLDQRIGTKFFYPGIGYGGSCFPKDLQALTAQAYDAGAELSIVRAAHERNERQKIHLGDRLCSHFGSLRGRMIAIWGIAFKPDTDDIREAPALALINFLLAQGAHIQAYDPSMGARAALLAMRPRWAEYPLVTVAGAALDASRGANALILCTEWHEFRRPDFARLKSELAEPVLLDGRNVWDPAEVRALGFTYYGIGRP